MSAVPHFLAFDWRLCRWQPWNRQQWTVIAPGGCLVWCRWGVAEWHFDAQSTTCVWTGRALVSDLNCQAVCLSVCPWCLISRGTKSNPCHLSVWWWQMDGQSSLWRHADVACGTATWQWTIYVMMLRLTINRKGFKDKFTRYGTRQGASRRLSPRPFSSPSPSLPILQSLPIPLPLEVGFL